MQELPFTETARRAQIVAAAIDTIAELGYGQASMARIAERVGITKGVIAYHFDGKEELIREIVIASPAYGVNAGSSARTLSRPGPLPSLPAFTRKVTPPHRQRFSSHLQLGSDGGRKAQHRSAFCFPVQQIPAVAAQTLSALPTDLGQTTSTCLQPSSPDLVA